MSAVTEVDWVRVRTRLGLATQIVTAASPEYDAVTGVVTLKGINLYVLAPLTITGFVWEANHADDTYDMPEDGDWITIAGFATTSTVALGSNALDLIGFSIDGGAPLTPVSVDATTDTDELRDLFNADPGYSALGTATTIAPGFLSIAWSAAWPGAHVFVDLSTGSAVASGNDDVVQVASGSVLPPAGAECQGSHGGIVYVDPHGRPVQVIYRTTLPNGAALNRWLAPNWSA